MDLNPNTLAFASKRLARYQPESCPQNILNPIEHNIAPFDSIGMNDLFHCVPGSMAEKAVVFDHLRKLMNHGCQVFGSTILQGDVPRSWAARRLMNLYNEKGIFSNTLDGLKQALSIRFENVQTELVGCVALFSGRLR